MARHRSPEDKQADIEQARRLVRERYGDDPTARSVWWRWRPRYEKKEDKDGG